VGSDKIGDENKPSEGYGPKKEEALVRDTLAASRYSIDIPLGGVERILYFTRGHDVNPESVIYPYPWLKKLWDSYFLHRSRRPSAENINATEVRQQLVAGHRPTDTIAPAVLDFIEARPWLRVIYQANIGADNAVRAIKQKDLQGAWLIYRQLRDLIQKALDELSIPAEELSLFHNMRNDFANKSLSAA
jgi:hypothetical protein